jgi:hypothetical protein
VRWIVVALAACGAPPPALAVENHVAGPQREARPATTPCGPGDFTGRPAGNVYGAACDSELREWMEGITVIASGPNLAKIQAVIGNAKGVFAFELPPGDYELAYYYAECMWTTHHHVEAGDQAPIYDRLIRKGCR